MKNKQPFSIEKHISVGIDICQIRKQLIRLHIEIGRSYPNEIANLALQASEAVERLRHKLDDLVCKEHPDKSDREVTQVYYPVASNNG